MKLFRVDVMEDCEIETVLVVAENEENAIEKITHMDWSCIMNAWAYEIDEIEGYKVVFSKGKKIKLIKHQDKTI